jgi:hypothetical protein
MIQVDFRSLDDYATYMYANLPALPAVGDAVTVGIGREARRFTVVDQPRRWFPDENPALSKVVVYLAPESE